MIQTNHGRLKSLEKACRRITRAAARWRGGSNWGQVGHFPNFATRTLPANMLNAQVVPSGGPAIHIANDRIEGHRRNSSRNSKLKEWLSEQRKFLAAVLAHLLTAMRMEKGVLMWIALTCFVSIPIEISLGALAKTTGLGMLETGFNLQNSTGCESVLNETIRRCENITTYRMPWDEMLKSGFWNLPPDITVLSDKTPSFARMFGYVQLIFTPLGYYISWWFAGAACWGSSWSLKFGTSCLCSSEQV